jgi:preprotein translocase subunit SecF
MSRRERRLQARRLTAEPETRETHDDGAPKWMRGFEKHLHKLQIIPLLILVLSIGYNAWFIADHGDFVRKGVSLAGGTTVTVATSEALDQAALEATLTERLPDIDLAIRVLRSAGENTGFVVDAAAIDSDTTQLEDTLVDTLRELYPTASFSIETTGPSLGDAFFIQTMWAVLAAFLLMGIVVFVSFRTFYPSLAVILAGFSTVMSTLAVFNLFGFALSTAGVAAFLMLIGYSIDTDILLSTRLLRRDGRFVDNFWSAMKTGLTMQMTTALAVGIILLFSKNAVFNQIMTVILIGMVFDVLYTWIQNAAILKWYLNRKERKRGASQ